MEEKENIIIGIDLGTSFSSVAIYLNNNPIIIPNEMRERIIPSVLCFTDNQVIIGQKAKDLSIKNPSLTIFDVKRLIGRKYNDIIIQNDIKRLQYEIINNNNEIKIQIKKSNNQIIQYSLEELTSILIKYLINIAENYLKNDRKINQKIKHAIITVPENFRSEQKKSIYKAGKIAGLQTIELISEPSAAALAYSKFLFIKSNKDNNNNINDNFDNNNINKSKILLVFDLGGGTFDISILRQENNNFEVIATDGDDHLGGNDFENRLVNECIKYFYNDTSIDLNKMNNSVSLNKLRIYCEKAKIELSKSQEKFIDIENLYKGINFKKMIFRVDFEYLCKDLFKKCIDIVNKILLDTKINKNNIDEILLVGGSTLIPKIREMLSKYFNKEIEFKFNPKEAVALGAAIKASNKFVKNNIKFNLFDCTPFNYGISNVDNQMCVIIEKGTKIPVSKTDIFYNSYDNQNSVCINIYEGKYKDINKNYQIGYFNLYDLPRNKKKGNLKIEVKFEIDNDNILHVTAKEMSEGKSNIVNIIDDKIEDLDKLKQNINGYFPEEDEENYKGKAKEYEQKYQNSKNINDLKMFINAFEKYINCLKKCKMNEFEKEKYYFYIQKLFENYIILFNEIDKNEIKEYISKIIDYLDIIKENDLPVDYLIKLFNDHLDIKYKLLINNMEYYNNKGKIFIENGNNEDKDKALEYFYKGIVIFKNNVNIKNSNLYNNFERIIIIYENIKLNLKKTQALKYYENGENYLKKGDKQNDYNTYELSLINFQKAYEILQNNISKNKNNLNSISENISHYLETEEIKNNDDLNIFEAKIIYKIVFVSYKKLNNNNLDELMEKIKESKTLIGDYDYFNLNEYWFNDLRNLYFELSKKIEERNNNDKNVYKLEERIKNKYSELFKELDEKTKESKEAYIEFILQKYPYNENQKFLPNIKKIMKINSKDFIRKLMEKYYPGDYIGDSDIEKKKFCIYNNIYKHLSSIQADLN